MTVYFKSGFHLITLLRVPISIAHSAEENRKRKSPDRLIFFPLSHKESFSFIIIIIISNREFEYLFHFYHLIFFFLFFLCFVSVEDSWRCVDLFCFWIVLVLWNEIGIGMNHRGRDGQMPARDGQMPARDAQLSASLRGLPPMLSGM